MPLSSAEQMLDALKEYTHASTKAEKDAAATRYIEAEKVHLRDKLRFAQQPQGAMARVLPAVLILLLVASLALNIFLSFNTKSTADHVEELQRSGVVVQREACERTNAGRVASIQNLHDDVRTLETQLHLWESLAATASPEAAAQTPKTVQDAFDNNLSALRLGIQHKQEAIQASIDSQAAVAIKPGSPVADCKMAYPFDPSK